MSWFDATGLASIAKSALKEAQKTIDKALDIKDSDFSSTPTNTPVDTNDDFFGTWGLTEPSSIRNEEAKKDVSDLPTKSNLSASLWGSFTGSFFETQKENRSYTAPSKQEIALNHQSSEQQSQCELRVQGKDDDVLLNENASESKADTRDLSSIYGSKYLYICLLYECMLMRFY